MAEISINTSRNGFVFKPDIVLVTGWDFQEGPDFPGGKAEVTLELGGKEVTVTMNGDAFRTFKASLDPA